MDEEREGTTQEPAPSEADEDRGQDKSEVDDQSEESFPASDPPAY